MSTQSNRNEARGLWLRRAAGALLACLLAFGYWCYGVLYVEGGSMQPTLFPGDLVIYQRVGCRPACGDVVVFRHQGHLVVHRLVAVETDGSLRMRGDANATKDAAPVAAEEVLGTVRAVVPLGRAAQRLVSAGE